MHLIWAVVACVAWRFCRAGRTSGEAAKFARESRENERQSREKNKNPISSRFLCPRPPLLFSAPNQNRHATQARAVGVMGFFKTRAILGPVHTYPFLFENGFFFSPVWPTFVSGDNLRSGPILAVLIHFPLRGRAKIGPDIVSQFCGFYGQTLAAMLLEQCHRTWLAVGITGSWNRLFFAWL